MQLTDEGLVLGPEIVLAKMGRDGLSVDGEEDNILTLLTIACGGEIPKSAIGAIRRASKHWRGGDKALAAIHLAQIGLRKIDEEDGHRLSLAAALIDEPASAGAGVGAEHDPARRKQILR